MTQEGAERGRAVQPWDRPPWPGEAGWLARPLTHRRARRALEGLSLGDAFGARLGAEPACLVYRELPAGPWPFTHATEMALSVLACLDEAGRIEPHRLARGLADRFDGGRGHGEGAARWVRAVRGGVPWYEAVQPPPGSGASLVVGTGEREGGLDGAARAAPIGAWFAGEPEVARDQARASAQVTEAHVEGLAGAQAVAVAAALVARHHHAGPPDAAALLSAILRLLDDPSDTREGLRRARDLGRVDPVRAAGVLGSGREGSSPDAVAFALWCAAHHLEDFPAAMWAAASGPGDAGAVCAIAGGVVALVARDLPASWLTRREALPVAGT